MISQAFDVLVLTVYDEQDRILIISQIDVIQDLSDLKNLNLKIIKIQGNLHLQINGELTNIGNTSIVFELFFLCPLENGIRCKIIKPQGQEIQFNPYYNSILGFIDFSFYIQRTDKLIDVFNKMKTQFKIQHPYEGMNEFKQQEMNQFTNNIQNSWNELNSINEFLILELNEGLKRKACIKQMIIDGQEMVNELKKEIDLLNQFKKQNQDKNVDENNILQIISLKTSHQDQLIEIDAKIKSIRDTLRLIQHNFQNNHINFFELNQFTKNLAKEEFDAHLLLKKCLNQQLE